ncbi:MAG: NUDIX hydrolase [Candidatus Shapirobacteria bacterium GW2011_GWF1_38_23]|nr:MAG: NUDIX hydrolase [Candidatus Shapirobacteria bacterium GW2011_GWF1_38_23]
MPVKQENLYYDERSAGGIVFKVVESRVFWFVIKTLSKNKLGRNGKKIRLSVYKFPKGHLNAGEVLKQAAIREVEEEGRIKANIVDKVGSRDYIIWDEASNRKIIKKVTFFLMEYQAESNLKYYDMETVVAREWFTYEETLKKLAYDFERNLLKKANSKLTALLKAKK